ncbi:MAG TPA: YqgE/AlgH family protein [Bryobacterales bacterium]|nr:YqgE/AlgH family protein [Bryobacterales bacterium]
MHSYQGQLLVASAHLADPNFFRTVVLIIQHDADEGTFGVVLNRPSNKRVSELWQEVCGESCSCDAWVHIGGPVSGPILALHRDVCHSQDEVLPGLYLAADRERLRELVQAGSKEGPVRLFCGYAGWAAGQLESELAEGSWLVTPACVEDVFAPPHDLWERVLRRIGRAALEPVLASVPVPEDPSWN